MDRINLVIGYNNTGIAEPCDICGERYQADIPIELFRENTKIVVCRDCGREHAPELASLLDNHYPEFG